MTGLPKLILCLWIATFAPLSAAAAGEIASIIEIAKSRGAGGDVYLFRGGMGSVFSRGLNQLGKDLEAQGIKAQVLSHRQWRQALQDIVANKPKRGRRPVILIGHSLGANRAIDIARALQREKIRVDYLASFAATKPAPLPRNIRRATNFYFKTDGWGKPLVAGKGFRGRLRNVDFSNNSAVGHFNIDEQRDLHRQIVNRVLRIFGLSRRAKSAGLLNLSAG